MLSPSHGLCNYLVMCSRSLACTLPVLEANLLLCALMSPHNPWLMWNRHISEAHLAPGHVAI